jgi:hypothetical protein
MGLAIAQPANRLRAGVNARGHRRFFHLARRVGHAAVVLLAWASLTSGARAEGLAEGCMTLVGDLSILPALPQTHETPDLWCEDGSDPRCTVSTTRGAQTDSAHARASGSAALATIRWPARRAAPSNLTCDVSRPVGADVTNRIDRPPRLG